MTSKEKFVLDHYEIYPDGRVYSNFTKKFLKFRTDEDGYFDVGLVYNDAGGRMPFRVHRLVALKYIPQPEGYNVTNHKDLNKQNNNVENLEWSTVALNTQHGYANSAYEHIKSVKVTEIDGTTHVFPSISHASRFYNYANPSGIQFLLSKGRGLVSKGLRKGICFEYTNESVTTIERVTTTAGSE